MICFRLLEGGRTGPVVTQQILSRATFFRASKMVQRLYTLTRVPVAVYPIIGLGIGCSLFAAAFVARISQHPDVVAPWERFAPLSLTGRQLLQPTSVLERAGRRNYKVFRPAGAS